MQKASSATLSSLERFGDGEWPGVHFPKPRQLWEEELDRSKNGDRETTAEVQKEI